ncbi:MAG TPA: serine/threonine protein kinase, partial [Thermoanaerobaculia bacterium]|nr:serine/threonine protein kinase [Thermoanaerobaculia bacterium]
MTPERWQRLKVLFTEALRNPAGASASIEAACEGDAELLAEARALLDEHARADGFLESPADTIVFRDLERVGPYAVVREIGRGGMGTVYLAAREDGTFRRNVALKVVRRGLDTEDVLRRFFAER